MSAEGSAAKLATPLGARRCLGYRIAVRQLPYGSVASGLRYLAPAADPAPSGPGIGFRGRLRGGCLGLLKPFFRFIGRGQGTTSIKTILGHLACLPCDLGRRTSRGECCHAETAASVLALALDCGPLPVTEALIQCRALLAEAEGRSYAIPLLGPLAHLEAMQRQYSLARDLIRRARSVTEEIRLMWTPPWLAWWSGKIELLAGDLIAAEKEFRLGYTIYQQMGEKNQLSALVVELAEVLLLQGRDTEALRLTEVSRIAAGSDDIWSHILWRSLQARLLVRQRDFDAAERLAREAVRLATGIDYPNMHACPLLALAEVLRLADHPQAAAELLNGATRLYQQKGNLASLSMLQPMLDR